MTGLRQTVIAAAAAICVVVPALTGCNSSSAGRPVAAASTSTGTTGPGVPVTTTESSDPAPSFDHPDFGVVPTTTSAVPAGTVTCQPGQRPPVGMVAQVADPAAPVATIAVPQDWSMQGGTGDIGAQLSGPGGMSATVTVRPTTLDAQAAFAQYAEELTAGATVSALSVLPAQLCDYSGQKMLGTLSGTADDPVEFVDRVVHVWTNGGDYLVAIHVQAPAGNDEFGSAADQLTEDFEVRSR